MNEINLTDKVAIITGASSGIGAETAVAFAGYGAKLTLVGRNEQRLVQVATQCLQINQLFPLWLTLDLTNPGSCETVINKTFEMYQQVDILVNCAGKLVTSSLHDNSMAAFDKMININLRVPYYLSQLALPHLIKTKGNIINIGSSLVKRYNSGFLTYILSKTALDALTKHAAPELVLEGVRINTISPGVTKTDRLLNYDTNHRRHELTREESNRDVTSEQILDAKEVAMLICLTASDVFPSMNGSELLIDRGAYMT